MLKYNFGFGGVAVVQIPTYRTVLYGTEYSVPYSSAHFELESNSIVEAISYMHSAVNVQSLDKTCFTSKNL